MRLAAALSTLALVLACAGGEEAPPPPAAAPTLADFAGTWQLASVLEGSPDTIRSSMTGTADGTWTLSLEGRPTIPLTVTVAGDSLIAESAEYESVRRPGVMVSFRSAGMMSTGMMSGTIRATYKSPSGDEVVNGTFTATRTP
jgi:hypothetical protein